MHRYPTPLDGPASYSVLDGSDVGGKNTGRINTGTQTNIDTGGGAYVGGGVDNQGGDFVGRDRISHGGSAAELAPLFDALLGAVANKAPAGTQAAAVQRVEELKTEVGKLKAD